MKPRIVTIGVYGFDESNFFQALLDAHVDTFCDIRRRRGMRGSKYAFVNSTYLQHRLDELGIRYTYIRQLAPSQETRALQQQEDKTFGIIKRDRATLGQSFVREYTEECLADFDADGFVAELGLKAHVVALFCVERNPDACHRSLVASRLKQVLGLQVEHIRP